MKNQLKNPALFFLSFLLIFTGCNESEDILDDDTKLRIQVESTVDFGNVLTNQENKTIYFFASDVTGVSNCNGGCAAKWPPLLGEATDLELGATLSNADFGTITRDDGQKQITFKGWPLYYFSPASDGVLETSSSINGDGAGGAFFIAKPDYSIMVGKKVVTEDEDPVVYLVDDRGITLYDFTNDEENVSNCSGGCATAWPPLSIEGDIIVPSAVENFNSIERTDALGLQVTYDGRPLYYFVTDDNVRGNTLGHGGGTGTFFVVEPIQ